MRAPRRGEVWVHVDRLDRPDRRVWAVQWRGAKGGPYYQTAHRIEWHGVAYQTTKFFGVKTKIEPRLVLVIPGGVVEMIDQAPNMRVAKITTISRGVDPNRRARV